MTWSVTKVEVTHLTGIYPHRNNSALQDEILEVKRANRRRVWIAVVATTLMLLFFIPIKTGNTTGLWDGRCFVIGLGFGAVALFALFDAALEQKGIDRLKRELKRRSKK